MRLSHWGCAALLLGCVPTALGTQIELTRSRLTRAAAPTTAGEVTDAENALLHGVSREAIARLAVARDPGMRARVALAQSFVHAARAEGSRPPPELSGQVWNLPLSRPWSLGDADMYMLELRGMFPPSGALTGRARAALSEADEALASARAREREITRSAGELHASYVSATWRLRVHRGHMSQIGAMRDAASARYVVANGTMVELNRIEVELARLQRSIARDEGDLARAVGAINALVQRPFDAPLGDPIEDAPAVVDLSLDALQARVVGRPEAQMAHARGEAAARRGEAAHSEAVWPTVSLAGSYWQMPGERPGFGAMAGMTLPWLSGGPRAREQEALARAVSEREGERQAVYDARREVASAYGRMSTAARELAVLTSESRAHAHEAVEAARLSYVAGRNDLLTWIDAAREALDLENDEIDLVRELAESVSELEWAVGDALPRRAIGERP